MPTNYSKTKNEPYSIKDLRNEINISPDIVPSCLSITASDTDLNLEFAAALSGAEETALDAIILAHVKPVESIDVTELPFSEIDKSKLSVHPSYKPNITGIETYATWLGAGDELDGSGNLVDNGELGGGPILHLDCTTDINYVEVSAKFHPDNGKIWAHEAYIKFTGAPEKAFLSGGVVAMGTPLQQAVNLDLEVTNNVITHAAGGPGTGTHGFADPTKIVLVPRTFSHDGDWNYDGVNLTPAAGDGEYKMYDIDMMVHRFVSRIPAFGDTPYFSITSDETTELPAHYYIKVFAATTDGSNFGANWHASIILEMYRERTYKP